MAILNILSKIWDYFATTSFHDWFYCLTWLYLREKEMV